MLNQLVRGQEWMLLEQLMDTQRRTGAVAFRCYALAILLEQVDNPRGGIERVDGAVLREPDGDDHGNPDRDPEQRERKLPRVLPQVAR